MLSSICYNVFFTLFYVSSFNTQVNLGIDFIAASLFIARGYYLCLSANASTVGMDVIALIINKKQPKIAIATALRYINFIVLGLGLITYGIKAVIIGILFSFVNSYLLDFFFKRKHNIIQMNLFYLFYDIVGRTI
nr:YitT family protein [Vagococcus zengguangii]